MLNRYNSYRVFASRILVAFFKNASRDTIDDILKEDVVLNEIFAELKFSWKMCENRESNDYLFNSSLKELKQHFSNKFFKQEDDYESPQEKIRWICDGDPICF